MGPITAALVLANSLVEMSNRYVDGLTPAQQQERAQRIFALIDRALELGDKAHGKAKTFLERLKPGDDDHDDPDAPE